MHSPTSAAGSVSAPLVARPDCVLEDISEDGSGAIRACLCQRDMCNSGDTGDPDTGDSGDSGDTGDTGDSVPSSPVTTLPILAQIVQKPSPQPPPAVNTAAGGGHLQDLQERPRAGAGFRVNLDTGNFLQLEEELEEGGAGLRCYSCGSLLAPAAADPPCSASNSSWRGEVRSCGPGQACLLYTWARGAHTGEWSCCRAYFQFVFGAFL